MERVYLVVKEDLKTLKLTCLGSYVCVHKAIQSLVAYTTALEDGG